MGYYSGGKTCSRCGSTMNAGYYTCNKCGYYHKSDEEYDQFKSRENHRNDTIDYHKRQKALLDSVIENGFSSIEGYNNYITDTINTCNNVTIAIKVFFALVVVITFLSNTFWDGFWISATWGILYYATNSLVTWYLWGTANTNDNSDFKYVRSKKTFAVFDGIFFKKIQEIETTKDFKYYNLKQHEIETIISKVDSGEYKAPPMPLNQSIRKNFFK